MRPLLLTIFSALFILQTADAGFRLRVRPCGPGGCPTCPQAAPVIDIDITVGDCCEKLLALHNAERKARGLQQLTLDKSLCADAQHSANVQHQRGQCGHFTALRIGGENAALGHTSEADVTRGWMNSPGHRRNMLDPSWTRVGFGRAGNAWAARFAP